MITIRPFLNFDSPQIVTIWRQQIPFRGLYSGLTRDLLDEHVFSKPYFDREGLLLAFDSGTDQPAISPWNRGSGLSEGSDQPKLPQPVGFIHAGFAANAQLSDLDLKTGIISQLKVIPHPDSSAIAKQLIELGLKYLRARGARRVHVGSVFPHAPFYLGLYGGSRVPGILEKDQVARQALLAAGFEDSDQVYLLERKLVGFRTTLDRKQLNLRRTFQITGVADPPETTWWESCLFSKAERDRFNLIEKNQQDRVGSVSFWDMLPIASETGTLCRGLYDLHIAPEMRNAGMAKLLVGEALKQLAQQGIGRIEVQARKSDLAVMALFDRLGFEVIAKAYQMERAL